MTLKINLNEKIFCACGCGKIMDKYDKWGREPRKND
jgi:hypothetical protein